MGGFVNQLIKKTVQSTHYNVSIGNTEKNFLGGFILFNDA